MDAAVREGASKNAKVVEDDHWKIDDSENKKLLECFTIKLVRDKSELTTQLDCEDGKTKEVQGLKDRMI